MTLLLLVATVLILLGLFGLGTLALAAKRYRDAQDPLIELKRKRWKGTP